MKTLTLRYTIPVEVDVPDDFPVPEAEIEKTADWHRNRCSDGRHSFTSEQLHAAAFDAARSDLHGAIFQHYCRRIDRAFANGANRHMEARDALIARCGAKLDFLRLVDGGTIEVAVTDHPLPSGQRLPYDPYVVACRGDTPPDGEPGAYALATRTVFDGREAAELYARTVAASRAPVVIPMPLAELRVGEDRGRADYWASPRKGA